MCKDKYRSLGLEWEYMETDLLPHTRMRGLLQIADKRGLLLLRALRVFFHIEINRRDNDCTFYQQLIVRIN